MILVNPVILGELGESDDPGEFGNPGEFVDPGKIGPCLWSRRSYSGENVGCDNCDRHMDGNVKIELKFCSPNLQLNIFWQNILILEFP